MAEPFPVLPDELTPDAIAEYTEAVALWRAKHQLAKRDNRVVIEERDHA